MYYFQEPEAKILKNSKTPNIFGKSFGQTFGGYPCKSMGKNKLNNDYDEVLRIIADNVLYYRKQQGLSQEKLAALADIDRTYIGYIENAHHNVGIRILCQIAQALKLNVEILLVKRT